MDITKVSKHKNQDQPKIINQKCSSIWVFPKIMVPPQVIHLFIGFSIINHPLWGFSPYFWKYPFYQLHFSKNLITIQPQGWINDQPRPAVARHVEVDPGDFAGNESISPPSENRNIIPTQKWRVRCNRDSNYNHGYVVLFSRVPEKRYIGDMCFGSFPGRVILSKHIPTFKGLLQGSLYYQPKQCILKGKSTKMTIEFALLDPPKWVIS